MNRNMLAALSLILALAIGAGAAIFFHQKPRQQAAHPLPPIEEKTVAQKPPPKVEAASVTEPIIVAPVVEPPIPENNIAVAPPPAPIAPPVVAAPPVQPRAQPKRSIEAPPDAPKIPAPQARNTPAAPAPAAPVDATPRDALTLVGVDPAAEAVWFQAINDPTLPNKMRQDLIEDLNEEGFADPKHPTVGELPLIVNRIAIIEQIGNDAMDEVNYKAFQEAYKDLINMYNSLTK